MTGQHNAVRPGRPEHNGNLRAPHAPSTEEGVVLALPTPDASGAYREGIYPTRSGHWEVFAAHHERTVLRTRGRVCNTLRGAQQIVRELNAHFRETVPLEPHARFLPAFVSVPDGTPDGAYWESEADVYFAFLSFAGHARMAYLTDSALQALAVAASPEFRHAVLRAFHAAEECDARRAVETLMADEAQRTTILDMARDLGAQLQAGVDLGPCSPLGEILRAAEEAAHANEHP